MLDMMTRNRTDMSGSLPCFDADSMGRATHELERLTHYVREHAHDAWPVGPDRIEVVVFYIRNGVATPEVEVIPANMTAVRNLLGY